MNSIRPDFFLGHFMLFLITVTALNAPAQEASGPPSPRLFRFQIGFGNEWMYCRSDKDPAAFVTDPSFKSEIHAQIPNLFLGYRVRPRLTVQLSYTAFWKAIHMAAYGGSYYDEGGSSDWSGGLFLGIFQAFGLSFPLSQPTEPGYYPIVNQMGWETWGDLVTLRAGYRLVDKKLYRVTAFAGPVWVFTSESIYMSGYDVYKIGQIDYIAEKHGNFINTSMGLDGSIGLNAEWKFMKNFSLSVYADLFAGLILPTSESHSIDVTTPYSTKTMIFAAHKIRSDAWGGGFGLMYQFNLRKQIHNMDS